jgi:hypothetical protein
LGVNEEVGASDTGEIRQAEGSEFYFVEVTVPE